MRHLKLEYVFQVFNNYKDVDLDYYIEYKNKINSLNDSDFEFKLESFKDNSRYYIRSNDEIFKNYFRKISLPLISNLKIDKYLINNIYHYIESKKQILACF